MPVIMVTAYAESDSAIQAMKQGLDYLTKPFKVDEIRLVIHRALAEAASRQKAAPPSACCRGTGAARDHRPQPQHGGAVQVDQPRGSGGLLGPDHGESGHGQELVARTIHYNSTRAGKSFVRSTAAPFLKISWRASSSAT